MSSNNQEQVQEFPSDEQIGNKLYGMDQLSQSYSRSHYESGDEEAQIGINEESDTDNLEKSSEVASGQQHKSAGIQNGSTNSSNQNQGGTPGAGAGGPPGPKQKVHLFHPSISHLRKRIGMDFLKTWFVLGCLIISMFSMYWGALYNRQAHLKNLTSLVIIEDTEVDGIPAYIGETITELIQNKPFNQQATFHIYQGDDIYQKFERGSNITQEVITQVHHRKYWSAIHIYPNATYNQYQSYANAEEVQQEHPVVQVVYESGRDITNMKPFVVTPLENLELAFQEKFAEVSSQLISRLSSNEKTNLISKPELISTLPKFQQLDYRPYTDNTLLAPMQVGLIYLIIVSFFLFSFFAETHKILLPHVKLPQYLLYRFFGNQISYFVLALFISTVSAIFQIDFTKAFGKAGFVIYWFTNYLTLSAVGGANENMAMLIFTYNPPFVSFWLVSWVIMNVSPSFSPMALTNHFYRFGYMMPVHASNEIFKVLFLDIWKGQLGLYYGILVIWIVLNSILSPLILKHVGGVMAKRAQAAAAAQQQK
ncbi:Nitrosoguanidine resistance protein SNG1 [Wickerhamomyces ciferrii]|uniref:Nitrosoguanidine resistance protein SNG1 n=1 Tax=Wickerhamomyces ciferrii (strain ATCC 14091 / BCRC 22168 / CBS 111 / JCM 3599 / NBRC 0793 / NRRL Y-1031 F-60-10) TaxID=1206466 RepID=K0K9H1_WICCF|nr:Nitrosoguanidine resistance protein SNG1 [Wickerhamomyces ciferrii]CCH41560.1 Nitrosoguanidine resistance protein SNG1 [Wickerhamomyces ciferrii]